MNRPILFALLIFGAANTFAQFGEPSTVDSIHTGYVRNIIAVDIDNDNLKDIVISQFTDSLKWYRNLGGNQFAAPQIITSSAGNPFFIDSGDMNGDSKEDLLITDKSGNNSRVLLINNVGLSQTTIDSSLAIGTYRAYFTDFDNDGDQDIIACSDLMITLYLNSGSGIFGPRIVLLAGSEYYNMTVNDLNSDSYPDVVISSSNGTEVYDNTSTNGLSLNLILDFDLNGFVTSADIDNDSLIDVIFDANTPDNYDVYNNAGSSIYNLVQSAAFYQPGIQNPPFYLSDLNSDNYIDALYSVLFLGISWSQNDGTGHFTTASIIDTSNYYIALSASDLDNDGDNDILWYRYNLANTNQRQIGIIVNNTIILGTPENNKEHEFTVFPNPASGIIKITGTQVVESVELLSMNGKVLSTARGNSLDISSFANTIYLLIVTTTAGHNYRLKIIKQ